MDKLTHIGLDVHKDSIAVATLRPDASSNLLRSGPDRLRHAQTDHLTRHRL